MGYLEENPGAFDPKKYAIPGMEEIVAVVASHMDNLGSTKRA